MTGAPLPPALLEWAARRWGGEPVERWTLEAIAGGAVSTLVERITLETGAGGEQRRALSVVRKRALAHEIAGLQAAQAVRPGAAAIPELISCGEAETGPWLITASCPGEPLAGWSAPVPAALFDSLARLHARYHGTADELPPIIPRVDALWWRQLCTTWVLPRIASNVARHGARPMGRGAALVTTAADHPPARAALARLTPTLLHGDVHPGNVIVEGERAGLIDWGSARIGGAMLDLANLVRQDSDGFAIYRETWRQLTGRSLEADQVDLGYRWAALQIPVQYLPWMMDHRPTAEVEGALDRIEQALAALSGSG